MNKPLISIILPIYNVENYLPTCMNSLFNQTYSNLEIIMVDDGSQDNCSKMCDEYAKMDSRVVVYHKVNGGLSDARNYGIKKSKGKYITCIDPDDYVDIDYIEYLYNLLEKNNVRLSICQHRVKYDNKKVKDFGAKGQEVLSAKDCLERMLYHDIIDTSACAKLYHRDLFLKVEYPKGKLFEDIGTTYALILQCENIAVGYESKYNYIFHNNSIVNSNFKPNKLDLLEMTDKMAEDVIKVYPDLNEAVLRRRLYSRFSTLNQMLNISGYKIERNQILNFIKTNQRNVFFNKKAPRRDKIAIVLLTMSYSIYRFCWLNYQKKIMNGVN